MSEDEFVTQSGRRGRKISSLLLLISIACFSMSRMLVDARLDEAISFAWASVGFSLAALTMLVVVMPIRTYLRKRGKLAPSKSKSSKR